MKYFYGALASLFGLSLALSVAFAKDKPSSPTPAKTRQEEKQPVSICTKAKQKMANGKTAQANCTKAVSKRAATR